jgi:hypothetical protein
LLERAVRSQRAITDTMHPRKKDRCRSIELMIM